VNTGNTLVSAALLGVMNPTSIHADDSPADGGGGHGCDSPHGCPTPPTPKAPAKRGFASIHPDKRREISSKGGKAAHATGRAHQFTQDEARAAGRKGGLATRNRKSPG
jgi:general stress protein YciG